MKILIVDDEKLIAQGVAYVIRQFGEDYGPVDVAFCGREALEKMAAVRYDLVVTDVSMPGISGLDLVEEAKGRGLCDDFCILSGYSEFEYARTALRLGVEDYLLKPVDKAKLKKCWTLLAKSSRAAAWFCSGAGRARRRTVSLAAMSQKSRGSLAARCQSS